MVELVELPGRLIFLGYFCMNSLCHHSHEELVSVLSDADAQKEYAEAGNDYQVHWLPAFVGGSMVTLGNLLYGKEPDYGKFKALEVIARIPYQSWEVASYMLLTFCYAHEQKALELSRTSRFSRAAQDNETMHVIVMSALAKKYNQDSFLRHTVIPLLFSLCYFAASIILYLIRPKYSFQLNYVFECHAFIQYQRFVDVNQEELEKKAILSDFLAEYGRFPKSEYEFFTSVIADELIHRNESQKEAEKYT